MRAKQKSEVRPHRARFQHTVGQFIKLVTRTGQKGVFWGSFVDDLTHVSSPLGTHFRPVYLSVGLRKDAAFFQPTLCGSMVI